MSGGQIESRLKMKANSWVSRQAGRTNKVFNQIFDKNRKIVLKLLPELPEHESRRPNDTAADQEEL